MSCVDARATIPNKNVLVVPPTVYPLTLDEAKLRCGFSWASGDPREAELTGYIAAATERVQRDTGYALLTQTRELSLSHPTLPVDYPGPVRPLVSATLISTPDAAPPFDPADPVTFYPWVYELVVGWPTVAEIPPALVFAVGLLTAHYATTGRDAVVTGTIATVIPLGYEEAIADFMGIGV